MNLENYVGRIVRLNRQAFQKLAAKAKSQGKILENCFLVSEVRRGVQKLICYGSSLRIIVSLSDIVLI